MLRRLMATLRQLRATLRRLRATLRRLRATLRRLRPVKLKIKATLACAVFSWGWAKADQKDGQLPGSHQRPV